jgi:sugar lactone lactonase YvrE
MQLSIGKGNPFTSVILLFIFVAANFSSCKKDSDSPPTPAQPPVVISGISPLSGPYSTVVTITGSGFNANMISNTVKFNNKEAVVQSASATQLVATVPKSAGVGPVSVQNGIVTGTGPNFNFIRTITVSSLAGGGTNGFADGIGAAAKFAQPIGIASDNQGNIYVGDAQNNRVRKVQSPGNVSTLAGSGVAGFADGNGASAKLNNPIGVTADAQGNVYVADCFNSRIRKITAAGVVSTLAVTGTSGFADGNGAAAQFSFPFGIVADVRGNLYVSDDSNNRILKITAAGVVSTLAGTGTAGFADGAGAAARFSRPTGITIDTPGNLYVTDQQNNCIRKITPAGVVSTLAGGAAGGFADGTAGAAAFNLPVGIVISPDGNLYVADILNHRIRQVTLAGVVTTLAGIGVGGFADGSGVNAQFNQPAGIAVDAQGNLYVADNLNNRIRKITIE